MIEDGKKVGPCAGGGLCRNTKAHREVCLACRWDENGVSHWTNIAAIIAIPILVISLAIIMVFG